MRSKAPRIIILLSIFYAKLGSQSAPEYNVAGWSRGLGSGALPCWSVPKTHGSPFKAGKPKRSEGGAAHFRLEPRETPASKFEAGTEHGLARAFAARSFGKLVGPFLCFQGIRTDWEMGTVVGGVLKILHYQPSATIQHYVDLYSVVEFLES